VTRFSPAPVSQLVKLGSSELQPLGDKILPA